MANGILSGSLPPFVGGFAAGRAQIQDEETKKLQGMLAQLSIQEMAETAPMKRALLAAQVKQIEDNLRMRREALAEGPVSAAQAATAMGAAQPTPDIGPTPGNLARMEQARPGLLSRQQYARLLSGDPGLKAATQAELELSKPMSVPEGGSAYSPIHGLLFQRPKMGEGMQAEYGPSGNVLSSGPVPGYARGRASIAGAERGAIEDATAARDIVQIPGQPIQTRAQIINRVSPQAPQPASQPAPASPLLPRIGTNPLITPTAGQTAFSETSSREMGKLAAELTGNAQKAESQLANIDALRVAVDEIKKAGGATGAYTPMVQRATELVQGLGVNPATLGLPKDAGPYQVLDALANKMALGLIGVPGGMPANLFSESDRKFVQASVVQKTDTEAGFNSKLEVFDKIQRRAIEQEQSWLKAQEEGKSFSQWRTEWAKHVRENPLFQRAAPQAGGLNPAEQQELEALRRQFGRGR